MKFKNFLIRYSQYLALTGCAASFGVLVFNRKFIDKYSLYRHICKDKNEAIFCNSDIYNLFLEVGNEMMISKDLLRKVVLYYNTVNCPIFIGALNQSNYLKSIPSIGLPVFFRHEFFDETKFENLVIDGKSLNIESDSPEGVNFRKQILLTEDAKKFVLARQIYYLQSNLDVVIGSTKILFAYGLFQVVYYMNKHTKFTSVQSPLYRAIAYAFLFLVTYFMQREILEAYSSKIDYKADKFVSDIGPRYYSGGIEFYSKTIKLNKILHEFGFEKKMSKLGNERSGLFWNYNIVNSHTRIYKLLNLGEKSGR